MPHKIVQGLSEAVAHARIERLESALREIAKMKPSRIADGLVHGPALLLANCQRVARAALKQSNQ